MKLLTAKNYRSVKWYCLLAFTVTTVLSYFALIGGPLSYQTPSEKTGSTLTPLGISQAEATTSEPQQQEDSLYENSQFGFSIEYPDDWRVDEGNASGTGVVAAFTSPLESDFDTFAENFAIGVQNLPNGTSLDDYGSAAVALLRSNTSLELIQNATATTFGDFPAQEIEYTLEIPEERNLGARDATTIQGKQVWTISEGSAYVLSFAAAQDEFSRHLPVVEQIIDTFRLTNTAR